MNEQAIQARIEACALIDLDRNRDAISVIAEAEGIPVMDAARNYSRDCIKRIAKGKSWAKALVVYEDMQVGYRTHRIKSRKVIGELWAMWNDTAPSAEDDYLAIQEATAQAERERRVDAILGDYWEAYVSRLSRTVRAHIEALLLDRHEPDYIMSRTGERDPETRGLRNLVDHIHRVWKHRGAVSRREMIGLMRQYLEVVPDAPGTPSLPSPRAD